MNIKELKIIKEIEDYVLKCGGSFSSWYIGIAEDPRERLFNEHSVSEKEDIWIYRITSSSEIASNVEQHFLDLGMYGGVVEEITY